MKIIGLFFMTLVFGIISMITSKKYKLQGELKELCFPPVFSKILYGCFIISMICSVVIIYLWQDTGITILFLVMGIISAFTAWAISKYKIIIEEQELIVIYPMKKRKISITKIEYIEISTSGSIKIIVQNEKKINLDAMLIGTESFIEYMKKNGVPIQENKGND